MESPTQQRKDYEISLGAGYKWVCGIGMGGLKLTA